MNGEEGGLKKIPVSQRECETQAKDQTNIL